MAFPACATCLPFCALLACLITASHAGEKSTKCVLTQITSATLKNSDLRALGFDPWISTRIAEKRPDVAEVIAALHEGRKNRYVTYSPSSLPEKFYRENLPKYFSADLWKPVTLYRGIDRDTLALDFIGERRLIWSSLDLGDAVSYSTGRAAEMRRHKQAHSLVVSIEVPRFLVYKRSGVPVLRLEDVPDLEPFIRGVHKIRLDRETVEFIEQNPGLQQKIVDYLKEKQPGALQDSGEQWVPGKDLESLREK